MNSVIRIRPCTPDDAPAIVSFTDSLVEQLYFSPRTPLPLSPDAFSEELKKRHMPITLTVDDVPAAHANFMHVGSTCYIGNLVVHQHYRGRGFASDMLRIMEDVALHAYDASRIEIACLEQNLKAGALFVRHGFIPFENRSIQSADGASHVLKMFFKSPRAVSGVAT